MPRTVPVDPPRVNLVEALDDRDTSGSPPLVPATAPSPVTIIAGVEPRGWCLKIDYM